MVNYSNKRGFHMSIKDEHIVRIHDDLKNIISGEVEAHKQRGVKISFPAASMVVARKLTGQKHVLSRNKRGGSVFFL
jgi:DNA primase catalytic subunit